MKKSKLLALILAGCIAVSSLTACGAAIRHQARAAALRRAALSLQRMASVI